MEVKWEDKMQLEYIVLIVKKKQESPDLVVFTIIYLFVNTYTGQRSLSKQILYMYIKHFFILKHVFYDWLS